MLLAALQAQGNPEHYPVRFIPLLFELENLTYSKDLQILIGFGFAVRGPIPPHPLFETI